MPLFEFVCAQCSKQFTFLCGVVRDEKVPQCPRCGSEKLSKLMSRFARGRDDDARMDAIGEKLDSAATDDPATLRRFAREMSREIEAETGENLEGDFEELATEESAGESAGADRSSSFRDETIY